MTRIENEIQYNWAVKKIEELLPLVDEHAPADDPHSIELELISGLVADYEDEHYPVEPPTLADTIKLRMYEMGLNQKEMADVLEVSPPRLSGYLTGKCKPTLDVARRISSKLDIEPRIVLGL